MKPTYILKLLIPIFIIMSGSLLKAQVTKQCGTDDVRKKLVEMYPEILQRETDFNEYASGFSLANLKMDGAAYIIPVVFHVVHDYGPENISDAQIFDAIDNMNADYSKTNSDFAATIAEFLGIAADVQVEFRLAQKELSGTCTNGIDRIPSMRTYTGGDAAKLGGWQHAFYLNIWVVKFLPGNAAAYAYYPTSIFDALAPVDGVICRYDYVGSIGAAGPYSAHTLSHEVGHYLNLQHTWGNNNDPGLICGDDQVPDTPETKGWLTCNLSGHTCIAPLDNVQNFMEYSYCSTMFTEGQKTRMYAALNSPDAARNNLWTEENLLATGTNDGYVPGLCAPVADFYSDYRFVCEGETVNFHDVSWKGAADSRSWEFEGGTPATSAETDPAVTFSETGWHKVTLTVNNASGNNSKAIDQYIYVSPEIGTLNGDYFENFNDADEVNNNWVLYNRYPDNYQFNWRGNNGYWNTGCIWLNSRFGPATEKDEVITPSFDLSDGLTNNLFFKYSTTSYATFEADNTMSLKIYYSNNCGKTWVYMDQITGEDLISSYGGASNFFPVKPEQWKSAALSLPAGAKADHVKFKIEFNYNEYCNNVFIDDFNFTTGTLDATENAPALACYLNPNPVAQGQSVMVNYFLLQSCDCSLTVSDIAGRTLSVIQLSAQSSGNHAYQLDAADLNLSEGCYFITLSEGQTRSVQKLIIL